MHSSLCSSNMGDHFERLIQSPPLVIAFRGKSLDKVMRQHRISRTDLNSALRKYQIWNIKEVECVIIGEIKSSGISSHPSQANRPYSRCCFQNRPVCFRFTRSAISLMTWYILHVSYSPSRMVPDTIRPLPQEPDVLLDIKGYRKLHENHKANGKGKHEDSHDSRDDEIAGDCA